MPGGWLSGAFAEGSLDIFYNLADAVNKIGFGLVVYSVAVQATAAAKANA